MNKHREVQGLLDGFLGTFVSRNSDYQGYLVFGFVIAALPDVTIDLLGSQADSDPSMEAVRELAVRRFAEQMERQRCQAGVVDTATLRLRKRPPNKEELIYMGVTAEHLLEFTVRAVTVDGRVFEDEATAYVEPHDPAKHRRRNPEKWGI